MGGDSAQKIAFHSHGRRFRAENRFPRRENGPPRASSRSTAGGNETPAQRAFSGTRTAIGSIGSGRAPLDRKRADVKRLAAIDAVQ
jgi:hypothetical protein